MDALMIDAAHERVRTAITIASTRGVQLLARLDTTIGVAPALLRLVNTHIRLKIEVTPPPPPRPPPPEIRPVLGPPPRYLWPYAAQRKPKLLTPILQFQAAQRDRRRLARQARRKSYLSLA